MFARKEALDAAQQIAREFEKSDDPHMAQILEFLIFGSTSREDSVHVGDLDIMIIFSYGDGLSLRSALLLERLEQIKKGLGIRISTDMLGVHVGFFCDQLIRMYYECSRDENFFPNVFKSYLRWDPKTSRFERQGREYLTSHYSEPYSKTEIERVTRVLQWPDADIW